MAKQLTCRQPDRDQPKLLCGYPLPCPYHTATLNTDKSPPTVEIPITADAALKNRKGLAEALEAIDDDKD